SFFFFFFSSRRRHTRFSRDWSSDVCSSDLLDVLSVLDGSDYFYFTSNKSQIIELCEWIETRTLTGNPFSGSNMITTNTSLNKDARYTDIMIYKLKSPD